MKDKTLTDLFDFYKPEDRQDFFIAYLYLKHMDHFAYSALKTLGFPTATLENDPGTSVDEMLRSYVKQIAQVAESRDTNIYHGKVMQHADARKLVTLDRAVRWDAPEKVVPYKIARDVILENPHAIAVGTCACRQNQPHPCITGSEQEVCLILGDPFVSFIAAHNPRFRKCSHEEALQVLEKSHDRGDVHTAYFKKEMGGRLIAICNCCSCCCIGMVMWNKLQGAVPYLASSGYVAGVSGECTACGDCIDRCPFNALSFDTNDATALLVDFNKCMGCGVCQDSCPGEGIRLMKEPLKGEPLDLDLIKTL